MIETVTYASHTAHLDPMTGEGLLVLPRVADDIDPLGGVVSLHAADWDHVIGDLSRRGWQPTEDDDGDVMHVGTTVDGRLVIGLYGREAAPPLTPDQRARLRGLLNATDHQ